MYGGFWKTAGDESQHTVTYPYSEAGLQSAPLLWLVSLAVCEQLPGSAPAVEALVRSAAHDLNGLGSGLVSHGAATTRQAGGTERGMPPPYAGVLSL